MRISHIIDSLDPLQGGPPVSTVSLAAAQAALGHDVTVVSNEFSDPNLHLNRLLGAIPGSDRLNFEFISYKNSLGRLFSVSAKRFFNKNIQCWEMLHLHGIWSPILWAAANCAIAQNVKWGIAPRGMLHPWALEQKQWKKRLALELGWRRLIRRAAFLHVLNAEEKAYVCQRFPGRPIDIIPNGVFPGEVNCGTSDFLVSPQMARLKGRAYILFMGRLHYVKGLDYLAEAFSMVAQVHPEIDLVVAGADAGMLRLFQAQVSRLGISKRVHVVGAIFGADKYAVLHNALCLCHPSRQEGFSMSIIEALASGLPVVISEGCHFGEVEEQGAGKVVELNASSIANALLKIIENDKWRKNAGQKAKELALTKYTWPKLAEHSINIYQSVVLDSLIHCGG